MQDKNRRGSLYAYWGAFDAGVALDGGMRHFRVIGARKWYDAQPGLLPK